MRVTLKSFDLRMVYAFASILAVTFVGCRLTAIHADIGSRVIAVTALLAMVMPIPAYWHEKQRPVLRDASLTIPWCAILAASLAFPLLIAARLRMPLQDALLARIDHALGVSVPGVQAWAHHHWLGWAVDKCYYLLLPLLVVAIFAPALAGKVESAREFLLTNLIVFAVGVPFFAVLPAVGPWFYYHSTPTPDQMFCQVQLLALRLPGAYTFTTQGAGIVCFPSFHVIWAILCARSLWGFSVCAI